MGSTAEDLAPIEFWIVIVYLPWLFVDMQKLHKWRNAESVIPKATKAICETLKTQVKLNLNCTKTHAINIFVDNEEGKLIIRLWRYLVLQPEIRQSMTATTLEPSPSSDFFLPRQL